MNKLPLLVVDDDERTAELLRRFLQSTGRFDVRIETRSAHAFAAAKQCVPALVLLDVHMPGKDGGAVAAEIRADPALANVPILFLTSLISRSETAGRPVMLGGDWFIAKPPGAAGLIEAIDHVLSRAGHRQEKTHCSARLPCHVTPAIEMLRYAKADSIPTGLRGHDFKQN